jgi:hypothetical protein
MKFVVFDAETAGTAVYTAAGALPTTSTINVTPVSGIFSIDLGGVGTNALTPEVFNSNALWLEITIDGTTLSPRKRLTAVPFAVNSRLLNGVGATSTAQQESYIPISNTDGSFTFNTTTASYLFATTVSTTDLYIDGTVTGIGSADLEDASNLAYLDASQTFTGPNTFTATSTFSTTTISELEILNGIVLGGVRTTTWPSGGGGGGKVPLCRWRWIFVSKHEYIPSSVWWYVHLYR